MTIDYAARVAKGAALLDEKRPGWERLIDLETLDITSGADCVTAQLSGSAHWHAGMMQLGLTSGDSGTYVAHGFNAESDEAPVHDSEESDAEVTMEAAYDTLNMLWHDLITTRLAGDQPLPAPVAE